MYVGHALLGFVLGALVADRAGVRRSRVLAVGLLAAGFAVLPDVDAAHTAYAVIEAGPRTLFPTPEHVWTAEAWRVHRALTHSLLVGAVASVGVGLLGAGLARSGPPGNRPRGPGPLDHRGGRRTGARVAAVAALAVAAAAFGAVLAVGVATDGLAGAATAGLYVAGAVGLAWWAVRRGISARWVGASAAIGLLTHPFGDLFMGRPPAFLYPMSSTPPVPKLAVAADPTVNLVALFGVELALGWAAVWTVARHRGWRLRDAVEPRAVLALGFGGAALVIRPPTLQVAYHFAAGTIAAGFVLGVVPGVVRGRRSPGSRRGSYRAGLVTGLAAVTLAATAYLLAYLALAA